MEIFLSVVFVPRYICSKGLIRELFAALRFLPSTLGFEEGNLFEVLVNGEFLSVAKKLMKLWILKMPIKVIIASAIKKRPDVVISDTSTAFAIRIILSADNR